MTQQEPNRAGDDRRHSRRRTLGRGGALALLALTLGFVGCRTTAYVSAPRDAADALLCNRCGGTGKVHTCPQCGGTGQAVRSVPVTQERRQGFGPGISSPESKVQVVPCPGCSDKGVRPGEGTGARLCDLCKGTGRVYRGQSPTQPAVE